MQHLFRHRRCIDKQVRLGLFGGSDDGDEDFRFFRDDD
jgi:hypothetical protein